MAIFGQISLDPMDLYLLLLKTDLGNINYSKG